MKFRTEIQLQASHIQLSHADRILSVGSCFAKHMGERLSRARFQTTVNPLGIAYNPVSLLKLLDYGMLSQKPTLQLNESRGIWHSFDLHSEFSGPNDRRVQEAIDTGAKTMRDALASAHVLMLTFGTSTAYRLAATGALVNNCHKYPGKHFQKSLLSLEELMPIWQAAIPRLLAHNDKLRIVLTVSPVRHVRDTLTLNSVSKATLRLLCHYLVDSFPEVAYFPAFEIMMDDLRDYRYYTDDLLHPTTFAQHYIWECFQGSHMNEATRNLISQWDHIQQQLDHRPLQPSTASHRQFLEQLLLQLEAIHPKLPTDAEQQTVRQWLAKSG